MNLQDVIFKYSKISIPRQFTQLVDHTSQINFNSILVVYPPKSTNIDTYQNIIWNHIKNLEVVIYIDGSEQFFTEQSPTLQAIYFTLDILEQVIEEYYCKRPRYIIGVTGSGGKTSTVNLLHQLCVDLNIASTALSTFGLVGLDPQLLPSNPNAHATYSYITNKRIIHNSALANKEILIIEVSSHGIGENRIKNIRFDGGIWTSFSLDHMEYHKTLVHYFDTKKRFIESLPFFIIGEQVLDFIQKNPELKFNKTPTNIIGLKHNKITDNSYEYNGITYETPFKMRFYQRVNLLSGMVLLYQLGYIEAIKHNQTYVHIPARMEFFGHTLNGAPIYSDDAYRPQHMEDILESFDEYNLKRLILIVGAGGDRKRGEHYRSNIGKMADKVHKLIVTDDNPRKENPSHIRNEIAEGRQNIWIIPYRSDALQVAFGFSDKNKIILILSHGSDRYVRYKDYYSSMADCEVLAYYNLRIKY